MKNLFIVILVLSLTGCGIGQYEDCKAYSGPASMAVMDQADAAAIRLKYKSGSPVSVAIVGDSTTLGSDTTGLDAFLKVGNPSSVVYNMGQGGWRFGTHISNDTLGKAANLSPKPDVVFIALGINDVKYVWTVQDSQAYLINRARSLGMVPVLVKENNIACPPVPEGAWVPQPFWKAIRYQTDMTANAFKVEVLDLGSNDGYVDSTLMLDFLHPNAAGYAIILQRYKDWFQK